MSQQTKGKTDYDQATRHVEECAGEVQTPIVLPLEDEPPVIIAQEPQKHFQGHY